MKRFPITLFLLASVFVFFDRGWAQTTVAIPTELGLKQALQMAEKNSPSVKAALSRAEEAGEFSRAADAGFFPTLDASAVDSGGFPGSASGLDGFSGLVASPYRKGTAADAFAKWDVLDLSQWQRSASAHDAYEAQKEGAQFQATQVDEQALGLYLETVRLKGNRDAWQKLADELKGIQSVVKRFVRNGQYSEVQGLLIDDQLSDAQLRAQDYDRQYQAGLSRLALLTGLSEGFECPSVEDLDDAGLGEMAVTGLSPLIEEAQYQAQAAEEKAGQYFDENLPKLEVAGSAGYLDQTRLEAPQDYSYFVGITMPLFEGFRIDAEEKGARAEADARRSDMNADQLVINDLNVRYGEQVEEAQEDLATLTQEAQRAQKAVALAKERYLSFLGPLSDLQQSLKDMVTVDTQTADVKAELLLAAGSRYFLNGGMVEDLK